jgi:hypothetical protein
MKVILIFVTILIMTELFFTPPSYCEECFSADDFLHFLKNSRRTSTDLLSPQFVKRTLNVGWIVQPCQSGCSNIMLYPAPSADKDCELYLTFSRKDSQEVLYRMEVYYTDQSLDKVWNLADKSLQALSPIVPSSSIEALASTPSKTASQERIDFSYHWRPPEYVNHEVRVGGGVMGDISYSSKSTRWILNIHIVFEDK